MTGFRTALALLCLAVSTALGPANAQTRAPTSCPKAPKIGQTVSIAGKIAKLDKSGNQGVIFLQNCRIVIFAQGNLQACRRGGTISARGRVQLYDLYPTMEAFFINPRKVSCS
jgi:hypothetical protein